MESLTEDLWVMVLARLPIKIFTGFKLVCKQWKSIIESPFFRNLFISVHQNSHSSSWSLMSRTYVDPEILGHYQCDTWGLDRSLGYFIVSFLADMSQKHKDRQVSIKAYSDVGFILIHIKSTIKEKGVIYVANPVSQECVEIFLDPIPIGFGTYESLWQWGIVTRTENGVLLGYKLIIIDQFLRYRKLSCLMYSSETGLWSLETLQLPNSFNYRYSGYPIGLNGNLHWLTKNNNNDVVLSMDFFATSTGYDRCRVTPFPDLEKTTKFTRFCTPCQGFLMYMNIVGGRLEEKLCVWKLQSEGWQLISEISPCFSLTCLDYLPLMINPLDAKTAYFWSMKQKQLLSINLHNGKFMIHNQFEAMVSLKRQIERVSIGRKYFIPFVLPQWLHRIPNINPQ